MSHYKLEDRRFFVAISSGLVTGSLGFLWNSIMPASTTLIAYYGITKEQFIIPSGAIYMGALLSFMTLALPVLSRCGIRTIVIIAGSFIVSGAALRMASYQRNMMGYWFLVGGNGLAGFATPLLVGLPTRLQSQWFPYEEFVISIGMNFISSGIGGIGGFMVAALLMTDPNSTKNWWIINSIGLGYSVLVLIFAIIVIRDSPEFPPNSAARELQSQKHRSCCATLKLFGKVMTPLRFIVMLIYSLATACYWNVLLSLESALSAAGYSRQVANICGIIMQLSALPGVLMICLLTDKFKATKFFSMAIWYLILLFLVLLGESVLTNKFGSVSSVYGFAAATGFCFSSISPVYFTLAADITFPANSSIVTVIMYMMAQVLSIGIVISTQSVANSTAWYIEYGLIAISLLLSIGIRWVTLNRTKHHDDHQVQMLMHQSSYSSSSR